MTCTVHVGHGPRLLTLTALAPLAALLLACGLVGCGQDVLVAGYQEEEDVASVTDALSDLELPVSDVPDLIDDPQSPPDTQDADDVVLPDADSQLPDLTEIEPDTGPAICSSSDDCASPTPACDPQTGTCVACTHTGHCGWPGWRCVDHACLAPVACSTDVACAGQGGFCDPDGHCATCVVDGNCPNGQVCKAAECVPAPPSCLSDAACKVPWSKCDAASGLCAACLGDADCLTSEHCSEGLCLPDVCQPGEAWCVGSGGRAVCNADGSAILELACDGAKVCDQGACVPVVCSPGAKSCDGNAIRTCNEIGTAWGPGQACATTEICNGGVCEAKLCEPGVRKCEAGVPWGCLSSGLEWAPLTACGYKKTCVDGYCIAMICDPGATKCDGFSAIVTCNALGTTWVDPEACSPNESCKNAKCILKLCTPGARKCGDLGLLECGADALTWNAIACPQGESCDAGKCLPTICAANLPACVGNAVAACNASGTALGDAVACPADQSCSGGVCKPQVCKPGMQACQSGKVATCAADGLSWTKTECPPLNACDGGQCLPLVCTPNDLSCQQNSVVVCNATGTALGAATPCQSNQSCSGGKCLPRICQPAEATCLSGKLTTCSDDGLQWVQTACLVGQACDAGKCQLVVCTPHQLVCQGGGVAKCNATGTAIGAATACKVTETCVEGACQPHICTPGAGKCTGGQVETCAPDGLKWLLSSCSAQQACEAGKCLAVVCVPGQASCQGQGVGVCNASGTGYGATQACAAQQSCKAGKCEAWLCTPNSKACQTGKAALCAADGLSWSQKACGVGEACQGGDCLPVVCTANEKKCVSATAWTCNASGTEWATQVCTVKQTCKIGVCVDRICAPGGRKCEGDILKTCADDGTSWIDKPCGTDMLCSIDKCIAVVCTPGQQLCSGNDVAVCNASGTGYASKTPCGATKTCKNAICVAHLCAPGATRCTFGALETCAADGMAWVAENCPNGQACESGKCLAVVCLPTTPACVGSGVAECNATGTGYVPTQSCNLNQSCQDAQCKDHICTAGDTRCTNGALETCAANGLSWTPQACGAGQVCQLGACKPVVCIPNAVACSGEKVTKCDADGVSAPVVQDCTVTGELCLAGVCVPKVCNKGVVECHGPDVLAICVGTGTHWSELSCDDQDFCTQDVCDPVVKNCVHTPTDCNDGESCTKDSCSSGMCQHAILTGTCDDGSACSVTDVCTAGVCGAAPWATAVLLAGSGTQGFLDGAAANARFNGPADAVRALDGTVYVADRVNHRIRRIGVDGAVTTVAGDGTAGWIDGPAATARFNEPVGLAFGAGGVLYIADSLNNRIRALAPDGKVTTVAGNGAVGGTDGFGAGATMGRPWRIAVDAVGHLWVAEITGHRIRRVTPAGAVVTVAGTGAAGYKDGLVAVAQFNSPAGLTISTAGVVYVADAGNHRIRRISVAGEVTTVAGSGTAGSLDGVGVNARFSSPMDVALLPSGVLLVADSNNHRIRQIAADGTVSLYLGSGTAGFKDGAGSAANLHTPYSVDTDLAGLLLVSEAGTHRIRKVIANSVWCNDGNPCTQDSCDAKTGKCAFSKGSTGAVCDDANECTVDETCDATGKCMGKAKDCDDGNVCTDDACNPYLGACVADENAQTCSLGDACQLTVGCQATKCAVLAPEFSTVLGSDAGGFFNGVKAVALVNAPQAVARGLGGDVFVADTGNHRIRKLDAAGNVTTYAGTGEAGWLDGSAHDARFHTPVALVVDRRGNLFVSDEGTHRIRRITPQGVVTTVAGTGSTGYLDGPGAVAAFNAPGGLAISASGDLFVADRLNHRIRRIGANGVVATVAGSGTAGYVDGAPASARFNGPRDVALDSAGVLYVADTGNHVIRSVATNGQVATLAGSGTAGLLEGEAATARFNAPLAVAVDLEGVVLVADSVNRRLRKVAGGVVSTLAGSVDGWQDGPALTARLTSPRGLCVGALGQVYATDGHRLRLLAPAQQVCDDGNPCTQDACVKTTGKCQHVQAQLGSPCDDGDACTVGQSCSANGQCLGTLKSCDDGNPCTDDACNPYSAVCENLGRTGACTDGNACTLDDHCVAGQCSTEVVQVTTVAGAATSGWVDDVGRDARFKVPRELVVDTDGNAYVVDSDNFRVRKVDASGVVTTLAGGVDGYADGTGAAAKFSSPWGIARDAQGNLYISDTGNNRIRKVTPQGIVTTFAGSGTGGYLDGPAGSAQFNGPRGLVRDANGVLYVADSGNQRIRTVAANGAVGTLAGAGAAGHIDGAASSARFNAPSGLAFGATGTLFIAELGNHAIRTLSANNVATLAGGVAGMLDANGRVARFSSPIAVAVDSSGMTYVADQGNRRIRRVTPAGVVTTWTGDGSQGVVDGSPNTAKFATLSGMTIDSSQQLWVTDAHAVRRVSLPAPVCDDGKPCTLDTCNVQTGACFFTPVAEGGECSDNDACTTGDKCLSGACKGQAAVCASNETCTAGVCSLFQGTTVLTKAEQVSVNGWIGLSGQAWTLCYKLGPDLPSSAVFHQKCDNKGPTVLIARSTLGKVFGAYASQPWKSFGNYVPDPAALLFSVSNAAKFAIKVPSDALYDVATYGPSFGTGPDLQLGATVMSGTSSMGTTYTCASACTTQLAGAQDGWLLPEVEVFVKK